jgi:hypothetical protein
MAVGVAHDADPLEPAHAEPGLLPKLPARGGLRRFPGADLPPGELPETAEEPLGGAALDEPSPPALEDDDRRPHVGPPRPARGLGDRPRIGQLAPRRAGRGARAGRAPRGPGEIGHRGARGRQIVSPSSITASLISPGRSAGSSSRRCSASSRRADAPPSGPRRRCQRASTRIPFASRAGTRSPKARLATAAAMYGPNPGRCRSSSDRRGSRPARSRSTRRAAARSRRARA